MFSAVPKKECIYLLKHQSKDMIAELVNAILFKMHLDVLYNS